MASYEILQSAAPYYRIRVRFDDCQFDQAIVFTGAASALPGKLQHYADDYAASWRNLCGCEAAASAAPVIVEADPVQEPAQEGSDDLTRRDLLGLDGA